MNTEEDFSTNEVSDVLGGVVRKRTPLLIALVGRSVWNRWHTRC